MRANPVVNSVRAYKKQLDKWGYRKNKLRRRVNINTRVRRATLRPIAASPSIFSIPTSQLKSAEPPSWNWYRPYDCWSDSQAEGCSSPFRGGAVNPSVDRCLEDQGSQGRTRLHRADLVLEDSREQIVQLLADRKDISALDRRGSRPSHYDACSEASRGVMGGSGWIPLHSAAGNLCTVERLPIVQAGLSASDFLGNTPLHLSLIHVNSAGWLQLRSVKKLLDGGADVNLCNAAGITPFQIALERLGSQIPPALISLFLQHGANVRLMDSNGVLPFQSYLEKCRSFRYGHPLLTEEINAVARAFLAYGASPDATSQPGESLLCDLLRCGNCLRYNQKLVLLICEKADVNFRGTGGNYPLHEVIACFIKYGLNCVSVLRLLLDRGADPNAVNDAKVSPLLALLSSRGEGIETLRMTKALLKKGADPMLRDYNGRLAVYEAAKFYRGEARRDIARHLLSAGLNLEKDLKRNSAPIGHEELWWQLFDIALQSSKAGYPGIGLTALRDKGWLLPSTTDQAAIHAMALTVAAEVGLHRFALEEESGLHGAPAILRAVPYAGDFVCDFVSLLWVCQQQGIKVDKWYYYRMDHFD